METHRTKSDSGDVAKEASAFMLISVPNQIEYRGVCRRIRCALGGEGIVRLTGSIKWTLPSSRKVSK